MPAEDLADFLARFDLGRLLSAKGIAEGVSNSNFLVETQAGRFVLTLYERRIDAGDLPWFLGLMAHLADSGLPVPRPVADRTGLLLHRLMERDAALVTYLPGVSVTRPTVAQARAAGAALGALHRASAGWTTPRANGLGPGWWQATMATLGDRLDGIEPGLAGLVGERVAAVTAAWPEDLPAGAIHADLFPDNVLMTGDRVTGLIDFYFACTDHLAYDLAVLHAAWAFPPDGRAPLSAHAAALQEGYEEIRPLTGPERAAWPILAQGAALRFLLSRAEDWLAEPAPGVLVQRKDPRPFARRLEHYARHG